MRTHSSAHALLSIAGVVLLGSSLLSSGVRAQDEPRKYDLKENVFRAGDAYAREQVITMEMAVELREEGAPVALPGFTMVNRGREAFTDAVLKVDATGPTELRRIYQVAREAETGVPGQPDKVTTLPRQGKTLTFRRAGTKVTVTPSKGTLPAAELKKLREEWGDNSDVKFFPEKPVAVGEEWTVTSKPGEALAKGMDKLVAKGKLEEIVMFQGRECAKISVNVEMSGKAGELPMTISASGAVYHDLERQSSLSVDISGPASMSGKLKQNAGVIEMMGTGTFSLKETVRWSRVAGKPIQATASRSTVARVR